ncbi:MAG: acyl-phosphate glycerol 3-phosphate acyltransferase [Kordiimonadales bacterium]|nr:MAG: acyl-phosphate glycerol 3-phosphate acyltransferase [Kordiimonadales bacterium]
MISVELMAVLVASYLLGSVPFGLVLTRLAGLGDIREIGSGNIGATNVLRTGRKDLALATLLLDAGKAAIAVLLTRYFVAPDLAAMAGTAAFIGHCFPVFLRFNGGKGVATFMGTTVAIAPMLGLATGGAWIVMLALFRMSSLSALIGAIAAPIYSYFYLGQYVWVACLFMGLVIYIRHGENIGRILKGTEPKVGKKKKKTENAKD